MYFNRTVLNHVLTITSRKSSTHIRNRSLRFIKQGRNPQSPSTQTKSQQFLTQTAHPQQTTLQLSQYETVQSYSWASLNINA